MALATALATALHPLLVLLRGPLVEKAQAEEAEAPCRAAQQRVLSQLAGRRLQGLDLGAQRGLAGLLLAGLSLFLALRGEGRGSLFGRGCAGFCCR